MALIEAQRTKADDVHTQKSKMAPKAEWPYDISPWRPYPILTGVQAMKASALITKTEYNKMKFA